jgi:hypothetical protein
VARRVGGIEYRCATLKFVDAIRVSPGERIG